MGLSVFPAPASGPTLSEINNSISTLSPSPNNWTLLGTWTLGGVSTFTFSGLTGYKTYKIVTPPMLFASLASNTRIRVNGDTGNNYAVLGNGPNGAFNDLGSNNYGLANPGTNTALAFVFTISEANTAGNKSISAFYGDNANNVFDFGGSYATTSTVNSITIFNGAGGVFSAANASANLVHIYGAN